MEPKKKPLLALLLWSSNPLTTGAVTSNCHLVMDLFINIVQLQYPEEDVRVMTVRKFLKIYGQPSKWFTNENNLLSNEFVAKVALSS